jgi:hypothetical protein
VTDHSALPFDVAVARLHQLLETQHLRERKLRWVFRDDVALQGRSLLVSRRLPRDQTKSAADKYARAVASRASGIVLSAEGIDEDAVYCTVFVAISAEDAQRRMISGLKLSVLDPPSPVTTLEEPAWRAAADAQTPWQRDGLDDRFQRHH